MKMLPKLYLKQSLLQQNLQRMKHKCDGLGIDMRPHVKTIHDASLTNILKNQGISKISVSNIDMLKRFVDFGWQDISLAIPFPSDYIDDIQLILDQDVELSVYIDHMDQLNILKALTKPVRICIEIDSGQLRSGIHWKYVDQILALVEAVQSSPHHLSCLTSHFGFLYDCDSLDELNTVFSHAMMKVLNLKEQLDLRLECSVDLALGDTPSLLNAKIFEHTVELRAGNFMLNDLMIQSQGLCEFSDIACLVKAQVVSKADRDSRFVLHCGSVHLSKEKHRSNGINYGLVSPVNSDWPTHPLSDTSIVDLYQEHAVVHSIPSVVSDISIGDLFWIYPVHSCLAMDAMYHKHKIESI
tara:strand:- start:406 stop:1470 length:1065 start_codon:yes stop_codon:yes gene_type:complete